MKKLMAAILCIALAFSVMSIGVFAEEVEVEEVTSDVYTIDATAGVVSKVAPFTKVSTFEGNFNGKVQVVNVDGSEMDDEAYATENVYAKINGVFYRIDVEWPYDSVQKFGRDYRADGDVLFEKASASFNSTLDSGDQPVMNNSGFSKATSGYKLGYADGSYAGVTSNHKTVVTKKTNEVGDPIYVIENNAPRYAFLRSHYIYSTSESNVTELTTITKNKVSVTTATFKADMMGNFSIHHNAPGYSNGSYKSDLSFNNFTYTDHSKYIPNAVHFAEDGTVKIGGTYYNVGMTAAARTPGITTDYTWEAGKEYTVSIVQQVRTGADPARYAQVYGVYINGEKVFPNSDTKVDSTEFSYLSSGAFQMKTRASNYKFTGGISAVLVGAAPKNADDDFSVELSDLKVYTVDSADAYKPALDADITLVSADEDIVIDNNAATVTSTLGAVTASRFTMDGYKVAVNGNVLTVVSEDGLTAKKYAVIHGASMETGFYNAENGEEIESVDGVEVVGFSAIIDKAVASEFAGITPSVILAVYKNGELEGFVIADGAVYAGEMTKFTAEYDLSEIESVEGDKFTARAFVWNSENLTPLTDSFDI